jgi:hypothetical protein
VAENERIKYRLEVLLDASQARKFQPGQVIKAVAQLFDGSLRETAVE